MKNKVLMMVLFISTASQAQKWTSDLPDALRSAGATGKNVLLYFSVSEACEVCENLEENVFATDEFKSFADQNFILAKPQFEDGESMETKAAKLMIVEKYNKDGFFPHVVIVSSDGRLLAKTEIYKGQPASEYIRILKNLEGRP